MDCTSTLWRWRTTAKWSEDKLHLTNSAYRMHFVTLRMSYRVFLFASSLVFFLLLVLTYWVIGRWWCWPLHLRCSGWLAGSLPIWWLYCLKVQMGRNNISKYYCVWIEKILNVTCAVGSLHHYQRCIGLKICSLSTIIIIHNEVS